MDPIGVSKCAWCGETTEQHLLWHQTSCCCKGCADAAKAHYSKAHDTPTCPKCGTTKVVDLFKGEYCPRCNDWC